MRDRAPDNAIGTLSNDIERLIVGARDEVVQTVVLHGLDGGDKGKVKAETELDVSRNLPSSFCFRPPSSLFLVSINVFRPPFLSFQHPRQ